MRIPGPVGTSGLTTVQHARDPGSAGPSELTAVQHASGSKEKCVGCGKRKDQCKGQKREISGNQGFRQYLKRKNPDTPDSGFACNACHQKYQRSDGYETRSVSSSAEVSSQQSVGSELAEPELENIAVLEIPMKARTHYSKCVICNGHTRKRLPQAAAIQIYIKKRIYASGDIRCCTAHLVNGGNLLTVTSLNNVILARDKEGHLEKASLTGSELENLLDALREKADEPVLDFSINTNLSDSESVQFTGYAKKEITYIANRYIRKGAIRASEARSIETALAVYLTKLRSGMTNQQLSAIFHLSQNIIKNCISKVRKELDENLVPMRLGLKNISRELIEEHMSPMVKELHCESQDCVAVILDGTYIYIQKSSNNLFQRKTWSGHKNRHLVKPMVMVAPDGYILDITGPYFATENDATILRGMLVKYGEHFNILFKPSDVIIVDRGFRDIVQELEQKGYVVKMPTCAPPTQKQLTTLQANETRLVTKVRWKVEDANGKIKQFRLLDRVRPNRSLDSLKADFRIAASLINEHFKPVESDRADAQFIAQRMKARVKLDNTLLQVVDQAGLDRKGKIFRKMDENSCPEFPKLSEQDLRFITLGSYQLSKASAYATEHIKGTGRYKFQVCTDTDMPGLLRVNIQSRHKSHTQYKVYIKYDQNGEGYDAITGYMCRCKIGLRTVGTCCHVASVLWYLGYARHTESIPVCGERLMGIFDPSDMSDSDTE
jgi:hypothetical protein